MNILITGGSGLLASRLAEKMSHRHQITLTTRKKIKPSENVKMQYIKSYSEITLDDQDIIIHAASPNSNDCNDPKIVEDYFLDTSKLISKASNRTIKKLIFTSSTRVYGNQTGDINEENQCIDIDSYSKMKLKIEDLLLSDKNQFEPVIVRISNSFGYPVFKESNCWNLLAMHICMKAINSDEIILKSNGCEYKDFVPMNYVVDNVYDILINNYKYNIFNISSGSSQTVKNFALFLIKYIENYLQKKVQLNLQESTQNYTHFNVLNNKLNIKFNNKFFDQEISNLLQYCKNHYK